MTNNSSTGGYLVPDNAIPAPLEDDALDDFLHDVLAGITGLTADLVRPRWQPNVPDLPSRATNWCAFGIMSRSADTFDASNHDGTGDGADVLQRHEMLNIVTSFYGPNCQAYGALLRDGLGVAQNREQLFLVGMGLVSVGDLTKAPELIKNVWLQRADLPLTIRREIRREYPVLNLLSAQATLSAPPVTDTIDTSEGPRP
jgi:hypothetical protein